MSNCWECEKHPFVWELRHKGVLSYAVGTFHVLPVDLVPSIEDLIRNAENVAVEFDHRDKNNFSWRDEIIGKIFGDREIDALAAIFQCAPEEVARMPLLRAYSQLRSKSAERAFGSIYYFDRAIVDETRRRHLNLVALETAQEQASAISASAGFFGSKLCLALESNLDVVSMMAKDLEELTRAYLRGDSSVLLNHLDSICGLSAVQSAGIFPETLEGRNIYMVERSIGWLNLPSLVAVGVGHYIIEPSMLTMYADRGVEVKKI